MKRTKNYNDLSERQKRRRIEEESRELEVDQVLMTDSSSNSSNTDLEEFASDELLPEDTPSILGDPCLPVADIETVEVREEYHSETSESSESSQERIYMTDSDSVQSEEDDEDEDRTKFITNLHDFCLANLPDSGTNKLLEVLAGNTKYEIPINTNQLYGAIKDVPKAVTIAGGQYLHLGVRENLAFLNPRTVPRQIIIDISWDGVKLHNASKQQMWPIVMRVVNLEEKDVMLVGLFVGKKKDLNVNDFFYCLVQELNEIHDNDGSVLIGPSKIASTLAVRCLIADAPAKAFALGDYRFFLYFSYKILTFFCLGTKGHTGYSACSYCKQRGVRINRRTAFETSIAEERTDHEFRAPGHDDHHNYTSPFLNCRYVNDLIWQFPIDAMHLVDLGVMGKLIKLWTSDPDFNKDLANEFIKQAQTYTPSEFARKIRSLDECDNFKATELRQFALYLGIPMMIKCCSNNSKIRNFIQFSIGYRLLLGKNGLVTNNECILAKSLLEAFVKGFAELYGEEHVSFNVHGLLHLHQLVEIHGPLSSYTAYDFENFYQLLRKWVRKGGHYFEQIFRRWKQTGGKVIRKQPKLKKKIGPHIIALNKKDACIMLRDSSIWLLTAKKINIDGVVFFGKQFGIKEPLFNHPISSTNYNMFTVSNLSNQQHQIDTNNILLKFVRVPNNNNSFFAVPIIE